MTWVDYTAPVQRRVPTRGSLTGTPAGFPGRGLRFSDSRRESSTPQGSSGYCGSTDDHRARQSSGGRSRRVGTPFEENPCESPTNIPSIFPKTNVSFEENPCESPTSTEVAPANTYSPSRRTLVRVRRQLNSRTDWPSMEPSRRTLVRVRLCAPVAVRGGWIASRRTLVRVRRLCIPSGVPIPSMLRGEPL